jgi:hypothetical protein
MKVLNLRCGQGHGFEGWFASDEDFEAQTARGLLSCPVCGDAEALRMPTAPRLNLGRGRAGAEQPAATPAASTVASAAAPPESAEQRLASLWLQAVTQVLARTEDVGERFPEEARRIHYGEAPERGIRGQATPDEREALREEGIEVVALPVPESLKGPMQ